VTGGQGAAVDTAGLPCARVPFFPCDIICVPAPVTRC